MSSMEWPSHPVFQRMKESFCDAFGNTMKGIPGLSVEPPAYIYDVKKEVDLNSIIYEGLLQEINRPQTRFASAKNANLWTNALPLLNSVAQTVKRVDVDGMMFGSARGSLRNSFVIFTHPDRSKRAGQIQQVFLHRRHEGDQVCIEPFFIIQAYRPLSVAHAELDPFRKFRELNAKLYYNVLEPETVVLRRVDICSHFASYTYTPDDIPAECVLALSLDRVRHNFCLLPF